MRSVSVSARNELPLAVTWRGQSLGVLEIVDCWRESGRWWEGERPAHFFLIRAAKRMLLLCHDPASGEWFAKGV
jgi:hypothetical protein